MLKVWSAMHIVIAVCLKCMLYLNHLMGTLCRVCGVDTTYNFNRSFFFIGDFVINLVVCESMYVLFLHCYLFHYDVMTSQVLGASRMIYFTKGHYVHVKMRERHPF